MKTEAEEVVISTEFIKLDSFLKLCGACSTGGEAKTAVLSGLALVNGEVCSARGKKLRPGDAVSIGDSSFLVAAAGGKRA